MKGKTHSTEEIIRILRQADGGEMALSVCREHNISEQTFYRWKKKYGDMDLADAKRLKELEKENGELKKMSPGATLPAGDRFILASPALRLSPYSCLAGQRRLAGKS